MNRKSLSITMIATLAVALLVTAGCKSGGMALTSRGQLLKINIEGANELPDGATQDLVVKIGNRGVNNVKDVLVDVDLPSELSVLSQTADRGINAMHDPGSLSYHFTLGNVQPGENASIRFAVRTAFGSVDHTGDIKVTAWQKDLPNDKLVETRNIRLRR